MIRGLAVLGISAVLCPIADWIRASSAATLTRRLGLAGQGEGHDPTAAGPYAQVQLFSLTHGLPVLSIGMCGKPRGGGPRVIDSSWADRQLTVVRSGAVSSQPSICATEAISRSAYRHAGLNTERSIRQAWMGAVGVNDLASQCWLPRRRPVVDRLRREA